MTCWNLSTQCAAIARSARDCGLRHQNDDHGAGSVDAFDAIEFDVAGGGWPGDPGERAPRVEPGQGVRKRGDDR